MTSSLPTDFVPTTQAELARFMVENANGPQRTICPAGGRTALYSGGSVESDVIVSTVELKRLVDYPARDMTITVEAGQRIDELQSILARERQRLPIDIAQPERATLGGALATNTSGPRRFGHGTFRDYVIGISAIDAAGQSFKAGGRVVKNVAGYDICKLLIGSYGTLGVITQVTLKLRALPETSALLWLSFSGFNEIDRALERLLKSDARPIAIDVLNSPAAQLVSAAARGPSQSTQPILCLGVEGSRREVDWQLDTLSREMKDLGVQTEERVAEPEANRLWSALTEFPTCADDPLTFQANLLPSSCIAFVERATQLGVSIQAHAGNGIVVGQLPEEAATIDAATTILRDLRRLARAGKGNLVVLHCDSEWTSQVSPCGDPEPSWKLMQRLKRKLDPLGILNSRRFIDVS